MLFGSWLAGESCSIQSSSHALSAVALVDALASRVGSSLAAGAIAPCGVVDLSSWMVRNSLLDEVFDSGLRLRFYTDVRMRLRRIEAPASSFVLISMVC